MATAPFLRFWICSLLIICLALDTTAQRMVRLRSVIDSIERPAEKKDYILRREKRIIPGELFSRADLIRSQKELANLQYFNQETDTVRVCGLEYRESEQLEMGSEEVGRPKLPAAILTGVNNTINIPTMLPSPEFMPYSDRIFTSAIKFVRVRIVEISFYGPETTEVKSKDQEAIVAKKIAPVPTSVTVKVYPNPFVTSILIEVGQLPETGAQFNLYDISVKKIRQEQINNSRTELSLGQLTPGIYSYQLISKKGELLSSGKLVKAE